MNRYAKSLMLAALVAFSALSAPFTATAQNSTISPYSRFGYGHLGDCATSAQRGMGGVGYAMNNGRQINPMNPASYASIDTLTFLFDIGVDLKNLNTRQGDLKGDRLTAGLDYITMQFPLGRYMGASVGLLPYSEVGYKFGSEVVNGEAQYQGSGTVNQLYGGVSGRPFKGFTVGVNVSYLFGTLLNDNYAVTENSSSSLFERVMRIDDVDFRFGAQYSYTFARRHRLTLGLVYSPSQNFHGHTYGVYYDLSNDAKPDTVGYSSLKGRFSRPETWGAGINWLWNDRLMVEADFTYQPWSKAKWEPVQGFEHNRLADRWKYNLGIQYQPNPRGSYLQRVRYRVGGYIDRDYIMVGDNHVNDWGVTVGLGLPAPINRMTKTVVNLGLEFQRRTTSPVDLVKENYIQVTLGINFNELWFWQSKIQ